ncbi:Nucleotide modification associated domain 2 [compost metagenome]
MKTIVGDNIYHRLNGNWQQLNSHHSYPDGTPNPHNILNDTRTNSVLVSDHFFYFCAAAVEIPTELLNRIGYRNSRGHRKFTQAQAQPLISFLAEKFHPNIIYGDPFDFEAAKSRYSVKNNKITPHT